MRNVVPLESQAKERQMRMMRRISKHRKAGIAQRLSALLCFLCLWLPGLSRGQSAPLTVVSSNRFLCVFDSSAAMHQQADEAHKALRNILGSRASGQLHYGDTIGVWTFDTELHTGYFPLQEWLPGQEDEVTLRLLEFLKQQPAGRPSQLSIAMSGLKEVVAESDIITIFIFSTGQSPMRGTPFDEAINGEYQRALADMGAKRMPIVTVLEAKGGRYVKYTVNALPWPVVIPELPIPIAGENTQVAAKRPASPPNAPKPVAAAASVAVVQPKFVAPRPAAVVASAPTVAAVPPVTAQQTQALQPAPPIQPAPPPAMVAVAKPTAPSPPPMAEIPPVVATAVSPPSPISKLAAPAPASIAPPAPPVAAIKPPTGGPATNLAAQAVVPPPPAPQKVNQAVNVPQPEAATAAAVSGMMGPNTLLTAGCALLVLAGVIVVMITRRSRAAQGPSLITRSMDSRRK
jgi:hypothetical protein